MTRLIVHYARLSRTATALAGSNRSSSRHARMRRERLSMTACRYHAAVVEEADQRRVDVPNLVQPCGASADARLLGVDAKTKSPPAALHGEPQPA